MAPFMGPSRAAVLELLRSDRARLPITLGMVRERTREAFVAALAKVNWVWS